MIKENRNLARRLVLVDAGGFTGSQAASWEPRAAFLLEMMRQLGYDAGTIGAPEARFGGEMLRALIAEPPIPLVSANLFDEEAGAPLLPSSVVVERDGLRVGITAVSAHDPEPLADIGIRCDDPAAALQRILPELREAADVVVLIARMGLSESKELVKSVHEKVDVVVVGNARQPRGVVYPESGGAVYVTSRTRGQSLGRARVVLARDGKRPSIVGDDLALNRTVAEHEEIHAMVAEFMSNLNATLAQDVVVAAARRATSSGEYYLGAEACRDCHPREFDLWMETPHSDAFETLVIAESEALPECFGCHVTGSREDAGYDPRSDRAAELINVQCEACHRHGSQHARDGSYGGETLMDGCVRCHNQENSPDFDPEIYWLMVAH